MSKLDEINLEFLLYETLRGGVLRMRVGDALTGKDAIKDLMLEIVDDIVDDSFYAEPLKKVIKGL